MYKLLFVEDDYYLRDMYSLVFEQEGFSVVKAEDGQTAIDIADKESFDVVLLDIMLPKVNGIDVLIALRKEGSRACKTPVFMLTNLGSDNIIRESIRQGADGYILKVQVNPKELVNKLKDLLDKKNKISN